MSQSETETVRDIRADYGYGWHVDDVSTIYKAPKGLTHELLDVISDHKSEPDWMRAFRHQSLDYFIARPMPGWGADLSGIDFDNIHYYLKPTGSRWTSGRTSRRRSSTRGTGSGSRGGEEVPRRRRAQYESEVVYPSSGRPEQGRDLLDMDSGLREHEELVKQYFATIIPQNDNKFAALNSAVWSRGSFIYVPPGVSIRCRSRRTSASTRRHGPVRAHADHRRRGAYVHYVEGTAPISSSDSLHSAVVEIVVRRRPLPLRRSRTGRTTSTTSSQAPSPTRTPRWSGSTATSARR
jgi:Fe-S cluster assembly protein SufB